MLSYRHGFHAGNHADVLKHYVLFSVLNYYNEKDKPYWYIDTHSGAGLYDIHHEYSEKTGEYDEGIGLLQKDKGLSNHYLLNFLEFLVQFQVNQKLYPGSPIIAQKIVRSIDRVKLFELHPTDYEALINNFKGQGIKYQVQKSDGFKGLIGLLPPSTRRAVILVDPPYEDKSDYKIAIKTLEEAYKRFSTGCYILWYPLLPKEESISFSKKIKNKFINDNYLKVELKIHAPNHTEFGMFGSGLFILNPPYKLEAELESILPILVKTLKQDDNASFTLESKNN